MTLCLANAVKMLPAYQESFYKVMSWMRPYPTEQAPELAHLRGRS